jgi:hypothetical protein
MDVKGSVLGNPIRTKRVFSRRMWDRGEVRQALTNRSRKWITIMACICADGGVLPPGIVFEAASDNIQSAWVEKIEEYTYMLSITSPLSDCSNDEIGMVWLEQIFDRYTREPAGGQW